MATSTISKELVDKALHGDQDAWTQLYTVLYPRLLALARRRLFSPQDAEDAVSETMVRAVKAAPKFKWRNGGFTAWVFAIETNILNDYGRRAYMAALEAPDPAGVTTEEIVIIHDEQARVKRALDSLVPEHREILELKIYANLTSEEVASVVHKSTGAVRMAQSRALSELRALLQAEERDV